MIAQAAVTGAEALISENAGISALSVAVLVALARAKDWKRRLINAEMNSGNGGWHD